MIDFDHNVFFVVVALLGDCVCNNAASDASNGLPNVASAVPVRADAPVVVTVAERAHMLSVQNASGEVIFHAPLTSPGDDDLIPTLCRMSTMTSPSGLFETTACRLPKAWANNMQVNACMSSDTILAARWCQNPALSPEGSAGGVSSRSAPATT